MGVEVEGDVALGNHKIDNGGAQDLWEARNREKWEKLWDVEMKQKSDS